MSEKIIKESTNTERTIPNEEPEKEKAATEPTLSVPGLNFIRNEMTEDITKRVIEIIDSFKGDIVSTAFPNYIKSALERDFGEGWYVFSGKHFSGVCHFMKGYFAEFEIGGDNIVVIFKSYMPPKQ